MQGTGTTRWHVGKSVGCVANKVVTQVYVPILHPCGLRSVGADCMTLSVSIVTCLTVGHRTHEYVYGCVV